MKPTRRELIQLAGSAALVVPIFEAGCVRSRPQARLIPSRIPLPKPFQTDLPIIPVLKPARTDSSADYYELTARPASAQILPGLTTAIWGHNGMFPGPTIDTRRGCRVILRLRNELPVPIVNHLHGGRTPSDSDGYPTDLVLPAGYVNAHMPDAMARIAEQQRDYIYPNQQRAATLWYHDHRMDFTAPQVWRGLAGFYILRDDEEAQLPLPRGDKEIALLICDRSFDSDGSLLYPSLDPSLRRTAGVTMEYMGGVLGDVILVNGAPWPKLEVANTRYRFRILNASNARRYELALDPPAGGPAFVQIGSDGGLLDAPMTHRTLRIAPAERFDLIVDFAKYPVGSSVTLLNRAAEGPQGQIVRFHVVRQERDDSTIPQQLARLSFPNPADAATTRIFNFSYRGGMEGWTINGKPFDPARMDARPRLDSTEIWRLETDFSHPLHLHLVHFQVLSHSGRPGPYDAGWKDTIDLGPGQTANILVRFSGHRGRYVFHCHNLEHEDMAMMGNFEVL
ncbi:MAG TPA: multicopper oxidase family protein [Bryobacteraceae bacterium]|nr:multicopper oxidase family protein [Bryobacteraceae bacterium]